jgi:hypothetical protein
VQTVPFPKKPDMQTHAGKLFIIVQTAFSPQGNKDDTTTAWFAPLQVYKVLQSSEVKTFPTFFDKILFKIFSSIT